MLKRIRKNMRNILLFKKFLNEEYGDDFDKNDQRENPKDKNIEKTEKPESDIPFIKSIGKDLTEMASNGKLDKVVGREKEIKQTAWILMQKKKNNPVLIGEPGVGKAQPLNSNVLTIDGWKKMGDLTIDDFVVTPEGNKSKIVGIYPQGEKEIYEIEFKDGSKTKTCLEHLWKIYGIPKGKNRKLGWSILSTGEIITLLNNTKYNLKTPLVNENINFFNKKNDFFIEPYILGTLLGDGTIGDDSIRFTNIDEELLEKMNTLLDKKGYYLNKIQDSISYRLISKDGSIMTKFEKGIIYNLYLKNIIELKLNKKSHEKFIPEIYKNSDMGSKYEIIQGLLDTDGHITKTGSIIYYTTSKQLALDVKYLINSLGGLCNIKNKNPKYKYLGENKNGKICYCLTIRHPYPEKLLTLKRKLDRISKNYQYKNDLKNEIVSIKYHSNEEAQCIMIDDQNHLYITDDFIVTHNTAIVEGLAQLIVNKKSPRALWDKRIFSIDMGTILAGSKYKGQFEERMKLLITELENNPDIIIFIDEIHMLVTTGSESSNAANMLKPGLARGTVRCIGATTYNEYRESIEKDGALERRFNVVNVEQTSPEETLEILRNIKDIYEDFHLVNYSDDVLKACVKYSEKYMADKFFPDKAITLMDEVGAKMHLNDDNIPESIILLEEQIDELRKNKLKFLNEQDFDKAAEIREEEKKLINELSIEKQKYENESKTKRIDIKVDDIAEVLNVKKGIPTETLKEDEHEKLLKMETELKMSIIGQDEAIRKITKCIQRNRLGFRDPNKPVGVFLFLGSTGVGKCHGKGTKIIMYDGSVKNVEDIKIGDQLMGNDSNPRNVLSTTKGIDNMYKVIPRDGYEPFICNEPHILSLKKTGTYETVNIPIKEYINKNKWYKHIHKLWRTNVEFPHRDVLIDPYFMGLWLGDGDKDRLSITTMDQDIVDYLYAVGKKYNLNIRIKEQENNRSKRYMITGDIKGRYHRNELLNNFREYGLIKSENNYKKFIPDDYIKNSSDVRKSLLAGLIDSDGYQHNKSYYITSSNKELSDQILYLCRSLGYKTYITTKKIYKYPDNIYYNVCISGDLSDIKVLLKRKMSEKRIQKKNISLSGFDIEYIGKDEYYGFEIDGNHLYLLGDFTVTHNTHVVKTLAKYLFGSEDAMFRFDMSEYQQEHEVARMKGCFTPDTEVTLSNGKTKKISEINLGDKVLTHLGNNKNVVDMYVYKHEGELDSYKISNRNTLLNCTEQHEILAIKPNIYNKRIDKKSYNINNAKFYNSRDLKEGDILLYPKNIENCLNYNKKVIDMVDYVKDLPKYKYDDNFVWSFNDIKINRFIKIDVNFLRLAGYYLSEGGCTKNKKSIKFTFNINEKNYINETIKLLEIIFGTDIKIRVKNTLRHSTNIFVSSRIINIMLSDLFGRTCYEKKLPDFFMTIDKIMFHNFFETLFYGDGTKTLKRKMVYKTVSKDLSTQLNTLLKKFGYSSQFNEVLYKDRSNLRKIFNIILTGFNINKMNESLPNLKIGDIDIKPKNIQRNQYQDEDYYYYTILKKDKIYYKGPVYDISIEDDSTYITNGVSVHNSPPGYVGYGEGGQLTEKVRRKPNSIILLDEIEKANSKVYELFLQVFDDGVMTDGSGRKVDFKNTIIVMTSNVGTRNLGRPPVGYAPDKEKRQEVIDREMIKKELQRKFSPEFLNRIDDVIIFKSLDKESIFKIIDIELSKLSKNLQSKGLNLTVTDNFKHLLMEKGWNEKLGARPMKRAIQKYIEDVITKEWLKKTIKDEVNMDYDPNKKVILINNNPVNDEDLELNERVITKFSKFRRDRIKKNIRRKGITLRDRNDNNTLAQL